MIRRSTILAVVLALGISTAGCGNSTDNDEPSAARELPDSIQAIMDGPRYKDSTWSLLVRDVETGETFYDLNSEKMSFTGSTRKLFSVGLALDTLGADHRIKTPVYRTGDIDGAGIMNGDLVLVGAGDLTFGGRRVDDNTIEYTNFDHNDANNLGTATLTPQDPLYAIDQLAQQVADSGIRQVTGDIVVDDQLFTPYRVPNGNLLITPILVNENMVDISITPTSDGQPAALEYRPQTAAFSVENEVNTTPKDDPADIVLSGSSLIECIGTADCVGTASGTIPEEYVAPFDNGGTFVGTFRVEDPASFARIAFIEALERKGVSVNAETVQPNATPTGPGNYPASSRVAEFESAPYEQQAQLILKVSLNLGANLALSLYGETKGAKTVEAALAAEREALTTKFGIDGAKFDFPTNGSGSPDSKATPSALVHMLTEMAKTPVAAQFKECLPVLGENGSLATSGRDLPGRGHVFAKTGTTVGAGPDGETPVIVAQNLAGYIDTKSGRTVAYALLLNDGGPVTDFAKDLGAVIEDEARISSLIYEQL